MIATPTLGNGPESLQGTSSKHNSLPYAQTSHDSVFVKTPQQKKQVCSRRTRRAGQCGSIMVPLVRLRRTSTMRLDERKGAIATT